MPEFESPCHIIAEFNPISSFSTDGFHPLKRPRTDILTPEGKWYMSLECFVTSDRRVGYRI